MINLVFLLLLFLELFLLITLLLQEMICKLAWCCCTDRRFINDPFICLFSSFSKKFSTFEIFYYTILIFQFTNSTKIQKIYINYDRQVKKNCQKKFDKIFYLYKACLVLKHTNKNAITSK